MKIVVTCTTWKGRINQAGEVFSKFLKEQTIKPNLIYCWLSEEEFPKKEEELPQSFLNFIKNYGVILSWIEKNEYCHKRWYVYPKHFNDFVVSIDDDKNYPSNLIEEGLKIYDLYKEPIVLQFMNMFREFNYINSIQRVYSKCLSYDSIKLQFYGQTIFAPGSFPLMAWTEEMHKIRMQICPKCDESWLQPFLIYNRIPLVRNGNAISKHEDEIEEMQKNAIRNDLYGNYVQINNKKYFVADIYKYIVLRKFPFLMQRWKFVFPGYNSTEINNYSIEDLLKLIKKC